MVDDEGEARPQEEGPDGPGEAGPGEKGVGRQERLPQHQGGEDQGHERREGQDGGAPREGAGREEDEGGVEDEGRGEVAQGQNVAPYGRVGRLAEDGDEVPGEEGEERPHDGVGEGLLGGGEADAVVEEEDGEPLGDEAGERPAEGGDRRRQAAVKGELLW